MIEAIYLAAELSTRDVSFEVENFTASHGISEIVLKVTNNGRSSIRRAYLTCAFLTDAGKAIDLGNTMVSDLAPGAIKYTKAAIPTTQGVAKANCYVDKVY